MEGRGKPHFRGLASGLERNGRQVISEANDAVNFHEQLFERKEFADVTVRPVSERFLEQVLIVTHSSEHDDWKGGISLPELREKIEAVFRSKIDIENNGLESLLLEEFDCVGTILRGRHVVTLMAEKRFYFRQIPQLVIHYQQ